MKISLILIGFIALSGQAYSEEKMFDEIILKANEIETTRPLYSLMYYPAKGTFFGSTESMNSTYEQSLYYQSIEFANTKTLRSSVNQKIGYAYDSSTLVGIGINYQLISNSTSNYGAASTLSGKNLRSKDEKGLQDPSIFFRKKIKSQEVDNFDADFSVSFSPKTGAALSSTTEKSGNALRGSNELVFNANIGKNNYRTSWVAGLVYSRTGTAKRESALISEDQTIVDAYNVFGTNFIYQWIINPDFEINLNGEINFIGETNLTNQYSKTNRKVEEVTVASFGPTFILNYSPKLSLQLGFLTSSYSQRLLEQTDTNTGNVKVLELSQQTEGAFNLAAKYQF